MGLNRRPSPPKTLLFTTAAKGIAQENSFETYSGTLGDSTDSREVARKLFAARARTARVLTPEKFSDLWSRIEKAGLFELPPYPGTEPPEDQDHFVMESGGKRRIFTRPELADPPRPDDPGVAHLKLWVAAELALFEFLNEP